MTESAEEPTFERQPHDRDAESNLLGAMMINAEVIDTAIDNLTSSADFYVPIHQSIYCSIIAAYAANEPTDATVIAAYLHRSNELGKLPGGATYLTDLTRGVPIVASAGWYARRVADLAIRRRLIAAGLRIVHQAGSPDVDTADLADTAQQDIHAATMGHETNGAVRLGDIVDEVIADVYSGKRPEGCIPTGLADLDAITGGLHPGRVTVVAGRPGMGKTLLGLDFARASAISAHRNAIPSMIFTLEMSREEIAHRIIAAESGADFGNITNRRVNTDDRDRIDRVHDHLRRTPILIDDTPNMTISAIRAAARRAVQRHKVGLVVVDYMQLMSSPKRTEGRQQEISDISRGMKLMAKELRVPVIACSQLNRSSEGRQDRRPALSDLRESGSIEQDADVVILLHREDYYDRESPRSGEIDLIVAKNRFGPCDTITCAAQLDRARIVSMSPSQ